MHQGLEGMSVPERAWELWDSGVRRVPLVRRRGGGAARRNQAGLSCPAAHREERMLELELLSLVSGWGRGSCAEWGFFK